ncbi:MAG: cellulose binding domain-containing protein [Ruminococcus sp.]|nr:cellulose binding domain-containing protein [Ruminococcus sp.]
MNFKKLSKIIITGSLSTLMCASLYTISQNNTTSLKSFAIEYDIRDSKHGTGALPMTSEEWEKYVNNINYNTTEKGLPILYENISKQLPESCDLSKSIYFPPIGNQEWTNSCVSWAATYYQFTYEANKLNNITTTEKNAYSPRWTYNFINNGKNNGTSFEATYDVLKEHGALTMSDYPCYNVENFFSWSDKTEAMIKALNTRISGNEHKVVINGLNASAPENLNEIKSLLANGKVLTFLTTLNYEYGDRSIIIDNTISDYINPKNNCKERIVYRANELSDMGHAMTIVGYDDNVWCDINNNQKVDEGELGAFKIANSYGKGDDNGTDGYVDDGFIWIAYDALNSNTQVPEMSTNNEDNRVAVFGYGNDNVVYYIDVENKSPNYIGQLNINTDYPHSLNINSGRNINKDTNEIQTNQKFISCVGENEQATYLPYNGTLVFDYDDLCEPISDYIDGYNWFVNVEGNHNKLSFKITDNLSNTIIDFGDISTGDSYQLINLSMGDLDYNGVVDVNDSKILFNSIYNDEKLSNLQEYLASNMNKDFSIHAAITPSGYDDIGKVLDNLNAGNIAWDSVPSDVSLQTLIDGNYDVLFINCSEDVKTNGEVIKAFVEQGGTVYASDWAIDNLISAFPERNFTYTEENPQTVVADVSDDGIRYSTGLNEVAVNFDMSSWRLITSTLQDDVTTYLKGSVANGGEYPLAFSFPYGNNGGKVFYTSFHYAANLTDEIESILNDLTLTINHNKTTNTLKNLGKENGYSIVTPVVGTVDANMSSKSYVLDKLKNSTEFAVITDETGNFSIELTAPDGNVYTNYKNGEFLSGLVSDSSDSIQVYSLGKRGLRISNPNILSNEGNHWSYRVISHLPYRSSFVTGVAEKNEKTVLDYIIDYKVTQDWGVGQNIEVTITNIGETPIRNWALHCDNFFGTVSNVWNGKLQGYNIIRNNTSNSDIASGSSITIGYTLTNATGEVPEFTLCSFRNAKKDGYSVDFDVLSDWGEGFVGNITITNTTDTPIMAWELTFNADNFLISATSQFEILKNVGNRYTITGTYNGNIPIPAYSSITLQFNGEKAGIPEISNISMTEMTIKNDF